MQYILLLLMSCIFIFKLNALKGIFKSDRKQKIELNKMFINAETTFGEDAKSVILLIGMIIITLINFVYLLFYTLSMFYVGYFWFTIVSILQIVFTVKAGFYFVRELPKYQDPNYYKNYSRMKSFINILIDFAYIGYLLHFIMIYWH